MNRIHRLVDKNLILTISLLILTKVPIHFDFFSFARIIRIINQRKFFTFFLLPNKTVNNELFCKSGDTT